MPPEGTRTQKRGKCFSVSIKKEEELLKELNHILKRKKKTQKAQAFLLHVYIFNAAGAGTVKQIKLLLSAPTSHCRSASWEVVCGQVMA